MLKFPSRPWIIGLLICGFAMPVWAQGNEMTLDDAIRGFEAAAHQSFVGVPDDWSSHHVVFSRPEPGSETEYRVQQDPRYWLQQIKEKLPEAAAISDLSSVSDFTPPLKNKKGNRTPKTKLHNDWSVNLGSGAQVGPGQYPAKFGFFTNIGPICTTDYVVYNTGLAGSATQASIVGFNNLYATTCGGTVPGLYWAYNTGGTAVTAAALSFDGSQIAFVQTEGTASYLVLLKWHANTTGRTVTGTLKAASPEVTITVGTFTQADVGARITGTGIPANDTIASVLSGTTANLAAAPTAEPSETLTIAAETVAAPGVPPTVTTTAYTTCTAPCMTTIEFNGATLDTNSFPFYDYSGGDLLFAGDNTGHLHKFQHVFNGTSSTPPAEVVTTGDWPATVSTAGLALSTPVYDPTSQLSFVGEAHVAGATNDGNFHSVSSTGGVLTSGPTTDALCHGVGFTEGPILDPSATVTGAAIAGTLYIGCDHDVGGDTCGNGNNACLRQFAESGISGGVGKSVALGAQADAEMYAGAFDHIYLSAAGPTGNLYFCGNPTGEVTLYRIPITANVMGTPVTIRALSSATNVNGEECSPITEFYNTPTATDWLFMSVPTTGIATGCTSTGCVYSFNSTSAIAAGANAAAGFASTDGTSGIVVDDNSTSTGASQIYYSTLGNQACGTGGTGGCAVQAAQNGL